jgi:hypothetical protein
MFLVTTAPAPILHHFPIVKLGKITAPEPINVPSPIFVSSFLTILYERHLSKSLL